MARLFDPPPTFELPLSKGGDVYFRLVYKPLVIDEATGEPALDTDGNRRYEEADYPAGAAVTVTIETTPPAAANIEIEATIDGSVATVWGDTLDADTVAVNSRWRAVLTYDNGLDIVLCNGKTTRFDG